MVQRLDKGMFQTATAPWDHLHNDTSKAPYLTIADIGQIREFHIANCVEERKRGLPHEPKILPEVDSNSSIRQD